MIVIPDGLHKIASCLTDMVGDKDRSHRNALVLPKGVKTHGTDKIQSHLADLIRPGGGHDSQQDCHGNFQADHKSIPAKHPMACTPV